MKTVSLSGSLRENVGKKDARKNRREDKIPCVLYGGKEQVHFVTEEKALARIMHSPNAYIYELNVGGATHSATVQEVQYHPVTDHILHVDFKEVIPEKPVTISVPIKITGTAPGVLRGGKLVKKMRRLMVRAMVQHLPDDVTVTLDSLEIGDSVKVSDMKVENVAFLDPLSSVIVAVRTARTVVEETGPGSEGAAAAGADAAGGEAKKTEAPKK